MVQWAGFIFVAVLIAVVIGVAIILIRLQEEMMCQRDTDCPGDQICRQNECMARGCTTNMDCGSGRVCVDGECQQRQCTTNADCSQGQVCSSGVCIPMQRCTMDTQCPVEQVCVNGQCEVSNVQYVQEVVLTTTTTPICPPGFVQAEPYGDGGNGNLRQGVGNQPDVFLCMRKGAAQTATSVRDVLIYQYQLGPEQPCPGPYTTMDYTFQGQVASNLAVCPNPAIRTQLCRTSATQNSSNRQIPIQDIKVTVNNACPTGYRLAPAQETEQAEAAGTNGSINFGCGGRQVRLCIR